MNASSTHNQIALHFSLVQAPESAPIALAHNHRLVVGRSAECGLCINNSSVSRQHAAITMSSAGAMVEDLGSRHGTRVNGVPVRAGQPSRVRAGDVIHFGPAEVRVSSPVERIAVTQSSEDLEALRTIVFGARGGAEQALRVLVEVVRTIPSDGEESTAGHLILERLIAATALERALLVRLDATHADAEIVASVGSRGAAVSRTVLAAADDVTRVAHLSQEVDIRAAESIASAGVREVLCARIPCEGVGRLYLYLDSCESMSSVDGHMAEFIGAAARIIGLVFESFQRRRLESLREDVARARLVQERLLPPSTGELGGVRWCLKSLPGELLAGDFAGVVSQRDGSVLAWVGDVAGKGPAAAMLMAAAQAWLHACAGQSESLRVLAGRLNDFVFASSEAAEFATLLLVVLHADGRVEACDAGHGLALVVGREGVTRLMIDGGPPLGMVAATAYESSTFALAPTQRLVLVTDGVHEQRCTSNEQFGLQRVESTLAASASCEEDLERLMSELARFAGARFDDDVTILSLQRLA